MKPGWYERGARTLFIDERGRCVVFEPHKKPAIFEAFDQVPSVDLDLIYKEWKPVRVSEVSFD